VTFVAWVRRASRGVAAASVLLCAFAGASESHPSQAQDGIALPLESMVGDASRGRTIVANRQLGLCVLCHQLPQALGVTAVFQGNIAPSLDGAGSRWTPAQLRLRIVDSRKLNPGSTMPAYHRTEGLTRVGAQWQSKPILDAQQVEDVVAYLLTLK
jgi:L-cysteine S-thiosulfotransferase